ncbi:MAG: DUF2807 domain-containing protein [Flavobacteriaceae bacterium]|jgi:hypothetical protein|nr:DUF2807 domain-containing protein [Flavobacteriaceae bacterium]MDP4674547.1 DUF2807 domain-containing protein [Flavobacteriaceae bacterium]MDP4754387.1 DUF2807 domain-containing protein [Flavobacteriaceae bacterium]MDP4794342.1 DUF2807 domain-containing protein [Flavobacteriaceae bacterium]MDP4886038.1 DUF2807 domain-containing protein [Flavobacteriaceae bacterium]
MKKLMIISLLVIASTNTSWAQWGKNIRGNGQETTTIRQTLPYDQINVSSSFDVVLFSGEEGKIELEGESNLLTYVDTQVKSGQLIIKPRTGVQLRPSWGKRIKLRVPVKQIDALRLSGSGTIEGTTTLRDPSMEVIISGSGDIHLDLACTELIAVISGSGSITASGTATRSNINLSGSGDFKGFDLSTRITEAIISGSADISVSASELLSAKIVGSGDIYYRGNPKKIDSKIVGSGDLIKSRD